ncbi:flagellar hook protein FlgE [Microbacterium sp. STN6]|uniref:flagellar hook protein FlgE n=1 Tax=Microbacterium sp. STN6 TaxID=2995588 RepID=UPI002260E1A1|nr:flagellar hook protein FlgE [Microbacterium sp. STN6]MCX7522387.1 flagellar hook protein FlgE [Microbacterium sp. STN6]
MLRSLYSGISGLRSHQTMLDVTGNNIANVNTIGFKSSSTQFQDTLSQMQKGASGPQAEVGGTNPAQVGLGVQVAGIATNFTQGSAQATGKPTDMMISGDGFFTVKVGNETLYTRAGSFSPDPQGRLVTPDGAILQGWPAVNGVVNSGGAIGDLSLPLKAVSPSAQTTTATVTGNLPDDAADGTALTRDIKIYDASGNASNLTLTFTKDAAPAQSWTVTDEAGATVASLPFASGALTTPPGPINIGGVDVNMDSLTGYAGITSVSIADQDGRAAGTLDTFTLSKDGTLIGTFSNGDTEPIGRIALANFINPGGLEKAGSSEYRATVNSGTAALGSAGSDGLGQLTAGSLEMSNVDLSQEFTNLIVAQRGFQANARIITTSDEVLQELTSLKR